MPTYYCHQCQALKLPNEVQYENEGLLCSTCRSDFLEEMNHTNRHEFAGGSLLSLLSPFASAGADSRQRQSQQPQQQQQPQAVALGGRSDGAGSPPTLMFHLGGGGELDQMVLPLFHMLGIGRLPLMMDDASNLDDIVTQLLNQLDNGGPPPATREELRRIADVAITQRQVDESLQCFVCFDEFSLAESVDRLPCMHHFHKNCIMPWLEKHGTCPVCRKTLAGQDTTTQTFPEQQQQQQQQQQQGAQASGQSSGSNAGGRDAAARRDPSRRTFLEEEFD